MKFKILAIGLLVIVSLGNITAQHGRTLRKADRKYNLYAYADAVVLYKELYEEAPSDELALKIANCEFKMNQLEEAKQWYDKVEDKDHMSHEHHLHYGDVLESIGSYSEAAKWYEVYQTEEEGEARAERKLYGSTHVNDYYKDTARYTIQRLPINSEYSDFSPAFFQDGIVFASARIHELGSKHTFKWDNSSFLDLYYAKIDSATNQFNEPSYLDAKLNTKFHEGPIAFDEHGNKVIFTRNNYFHGKKHKSDDKVMKLKLYYADRDVDETGQHGWHHFEEFPYNSDEYSTGHPTITKDFRLLVFASDKEGGFGGTDLYYSIYENDKWSEPVNLGKGFNTEGDEMFPFLHEDGTLYFASNGRDGLGGLDIYEAIPKEKSDQINLTANYEVKDIGYPINTSKDDFGLIIDESKTKGYFSSNRAGGAGNDDIYAFSSAEIPDVLFTGIVYVKVEGKPDEQREILPNATVSIIDVEEGKEIGVATSDAEGKFSYTLEAQKKYNFVATKDTLIKDELTVDLTDKTKVDSQTVELTLLEPLPEVVRICIDVVDLDNGRKLLAGATVYIMEEGGTEVRKYITDADGNICAVFDPNKNYVIKSTKVKYLSDCFTIHTGELTKASKTPEKPLELELLKVSQKFKYDKILFDVSKHNIRKDAALELDKVVTFIKSHPGITVELGAHTDARGGDAYNEALSERRAQSSRDYIVSQGIDPSIITAKGYGETQLTNKCANGVRCPDALHQENRRTEIKITGIKDLSPEEEEKLQASIKGLEPNNDYSDDCETIKIVEKK